MDRIGIIGNKMGRLDFVMTYLFLENIKSNLTVIRDKPGVSKHPAWQSYGSMAMGRCCNLYESSQNKY